MILKLITQNPSKQKYGFLIIQEELLETKERFETYKKEYKTDPIFYLDLDNSFCVLNDWSELSLVKHFVVPVLIDDSYLVSKLNKSVTALYLTSYENQFVSKRSLTKLKVKSKVVRFIDSICRKISITTLSTLCVN